MNPPNFLQLPPSQIICAICCSPQILPFQAIWYIKTMYKLLTSRIYDAVQYLHTVHFVYSTDRFNQVVLNLPKLHGFEVFLRRLLRPNLWAQRTSKADRHFDLNFKYFDNEQRTQRSSGKASNPCQQTSAKRKVFKATT